MDYFRLGWSFYICFGIFSDFKVLTCKEKECYYFLLIKKFKCLLGNYESLLNKREVLSAFKALSKTKQWSQGIKKIRFIFISSSISPTNKSENNTSFNKFLIV